MHNKKKSTCGRPSGPPWKRGTCLMYNAPLRGGESALTSVRVLIPEGLCACLAYAQRRTCAYDGAYCADPTEARNNHPHTCTANLVKSPIFVVTLGITNSVACEVVSHHYYSDSQGCACLEYKNLYCSTTLRW